MAALTSGGRYLRASRLRSRPYEDRFFLQRRDAGVALVRRRGSFPQRDGVVFSLNRRRRRIPPSAAVAAQRFRARRKPGPTGKISARSRYAGAPKSVGCAASSILAAPSFWRGSSATAARRGSSKIAASPRRHARRTRSSSAQRAAWQARGSSAAAARLPSAYSSAPATVTSFDAPWRLRGDPTLGRGGTSSRSFRANARLERAIGSPPWMALVERLARGPAARPDAKDAKRGRRDVASEYEAAVVERLRGVVAVDLDDAQLPQRGPVFRRRRQQRRE